MIRMKFVAASIALIAAAELSGASASARGGAANLMNSPGYQRRLQESRQQYLQATQPVVVVPARRHRHRHYQH